MSEFITSCAITRITVCQATSSCARQFAFDILQRDQPPAHARPAPTRWPRPSAAARPVLRSMRRIAPSPGLEAAPGRWRRPRHSAANCAASAQAVSNSRRAARFSSCTWPILVHRRSAPPAHGRSGSADIAPAPRARRGRCAAGPAPASSPRPVRAKTRSRDRPEKRAEVSSNDTASRKRALRGPSGWRNAISSDHFADRPRRRNSAMVTYQSVLRDHPGQQPPGSTTSSAATAAAMPALESG